MTVRLRSRELVGALIRSGELLLGSLIEVCRRAHVALQVEASGWAPWGGRVPERSGTHPAAVFEKQAQGPGRW